MSQKLYVLFAAIFGLITGVIIVLASTSAQLFLNEFLVQNPKISGIIIFLMGIFAHRFIEGFFVEKRILKEQKAALLKDLMATRFSSPSDQKAAEAINYIPVLFAGDMKVRRAYAEYHSALINGANGNDVASKFVQMIITIAKDIGIDLDPVDIMCGPIFSRKLINEDQAIAENELKQEIKS